MAPPNPFDAGPAEAAAYDAWYDSALGASILRVEERCVRELLLGAPRPWLEIGAGSGRFGGDLGAEVGLDPAADLLRLATSRLPAVVRGVAEALPFREARFGAVMAVTVLEFITDIPRALHEVRRVLRGDGRFVVGLIPRDSPWGVAYRAQGRDPASVFHGARFLSVEAIASLASEAELEAVGVRSGLLDSPGVVQSGRITATAEADAGFVALAFAPKDRAREA